MSLVDCEDGNCNEEAEPIVLTGHADATAVFRKTVGKRREEDGHD